MSPPDWSRIEEIFAVLLTHPPKAWERVVDEECGSDPVLYDEVMSLLDHGAHRDQYFDGLARRCGLPREDPPVEEIVGRTVGSYRLERLLGRGGMGAVYRITGGTFAEAERVVCDTDPTPPEEAIAGSGQEDGAASAGQEEIATRRKTTPAGLRKILGGDLGRIVLMALRKEPERRYATVSALDADLRRYLGGFPVSARPDSPVYRFRRLVQRHRASAAGTAAVVVLGTALAVTGVRFTLRAPCYRRPWRSSPRPVPRPASTSSPRPE